MLEPGEVEIFYADPVDDDGNKIATATFKVTRVSGFKNVRLTKVPAAEIVLDPEATIHVRAEDFPDSDGKSENDS